MFTKIVIENIGPISDRIVLDFIVNKRDKLNQNSYVEAPGKVCISKIAGIIAGNSMGKTTILDTLNKVGSFIDLPKKKMNLSKFDDIDIDDKIESIIFDGLKSILRNTRLPDLNKKVINPIGYIELELYIDSNDDYAGFYNYKLKYDNDFTKNGLIEESLSFRKNYDSKKIKSIFNISGNTESEIGYKIAYQKNILEEMKFSIKEKNEFVEKIKYYNNFIKRYLLESSTMDAENYIFSEAFVIEMIKGKEKIVTSFINMADNQVKKIVIDDTDTESPKLYFNYGSYKIRYSQVSTAMKKLCAIASNYITSNKKGGVFLVDELDNSLNREIIKFILNLYIDNISKNTSQFIFTTYTPEILNMLRRDQIFILTKNKDKINLTKFIDYIDIKTQKKVRKDYSFSKAYRTNMIKNFPDEESFDLIQQMLEFQNK